VDLVAERIAVESYSEIIRWLGDDDLTTVMGLAAKHVIIMVVASFVIMAALALLLAIFQLAFHAQRGAAPASPVPPEARHSPRASPMVGQSPSPLVSQGTPENRDSTRPVETVVVIKPGSLTIPVVGVRPKQLRDTYSESRAEGRAHNALDIMAKCDTQIVAATAGKIVKLFQSEVAASRFIKWPLTTGRSTTTRISRVTPAAWRKGASRRKARSSVMSATRATSFTAPATCILQSGP
jgi:hypothetical protein